jgi:hypothetical protein
MSTLFGYSADIVLPNFLTMTKSCVATPSLSLALPARTANCLPAGFGKHLD